MFTLRAAVMWTVNDFPAYTMVSGWSTKGYMACLVCKEDVTSGWHAGKVCYLGHRRWLPWDHEWREKDKEFDGNTERRLRPREWSGDEIVEQLNRLDFAPFGKTVNRTRPSTHMNWTHKPMFFELPYWSKLKLRHNLDVMHVEKNVFDTLVGTILDIEGKTKDTIKARLDLERMGIRRGLWMNRDSDKARRDLAFFSLKPNDKKEFLKFVSSVTFPDGYASNIARCVNIDGGKFTGLKSHDCHVFMQRLLPVGIRHLLPEDVVKPIMLLSRFFSQLTAKTLRKTDILQLRHDIVQVLCKFEMIFPPAFFTSMMHVMVHLPEEALLAGPVNYRWMYPIERLLGELKKSGLGFRVQGLRDENTCLVAQSLPRTGLRDETHRVRRAISPELSPSTLPLWTLSENILGVFARRCTSSSRNLSQPFSWDDFSIHLDCEFLRILRDDNCDFVAQYHQNFHPHSSSV
ncbi:hypothetical protein L3X38_025366 [Prunus dulcis]|uniref:DUF4218 domain-containing protein n=1 Tax=Prunus dulcis TaxID=3755 RepID=A0AAD4W2P9_PRUDU|nr:hypothetical protein L3X38_025366 [Prunus dulcis]